jgi:invasion protein IalB
MSMTRRDAMIGAGAVAAGAVAAGAARAQDAAAAEAPAAGAPATDAPEAGALPPAASFQAFSPGWTSSCASATRAAEPVCTLEIRVLLQGDGSQLLRMTTQTGGGVEDGAASGLLLQVPLGLYNPAGVRVAVDGEEVAALEVQTCDAAGCYAGTPLSDALEAAMRAGERATVTFQDLARNDIGVPVMLEGFGPTLDGVR